MLYGIWMIASFIFFPVGLALLVVMSVTGWLPPAPASLMYALMFLMCASVPGVAFYVVEHEL